MRITTRKSKTIIAACLILASFFPLAAAEAKTTLRVALSKAPSSLPLLRMKEAGLLGDGYELEFDIWIVPEQLLAMVQGGAHHYFNLPLTLAARMHNRGVGIRLTNVNTWGGMCLVTSDAGLRDWRGLEGEELFLPPRGSPPDALARFFLGRAGLEPDADVTVRNAPIPELAQLLRSGRIRHAVLLEPQATAALSGMASLRIAFDFEEEWRKAGRGDERLPNIGFGGLASFLDANRELAESFETAFADALAWVRDNPGPAGELAEKYLGLRAGLVREAMPRLGLRYSTVREAESDVDRYFRTLFDFSPDLIGDRIPDATLYWR